MVQRYENGFKCEIKGCRRTFEPATDQNRLAAKRHQLDRGEHVVVRAAFDQTEADVFELRFGEDRIIGEGLDFQSARALQQREIEALRPVRT